MYPLPNHPCSILADDSSSDTLRLSLHLAYTIVGLQCEGTREARLLVLLHLILIMRDVRVPNFPCLIANPKLPQPTMLCCRASCGMLKPLIKFKSNELLGILKAHKFNL